ISRPTRRRPRHTLPRCEERGAPKNRYRWSKEPHINSAVRSPSAPSAAQAAAPRPFRGSAESRLQPRIRTRPQPAHGGREGLGLFLLDEVPRPNGRVECERAQRPLEEGHLFVPDATL